MERRKSGSRIQRRFGYLIHGHVSCQRKGYEVYAACANTGGFSPEQLKTNEENAYKLGAKEYVTIDVTQEYYEKA